MVAAMTALSPLDALLHEHKLLDPFPDAALREAEAFVAHPGVDDPALINLTHLPFVTIDEVSSRDLDQALVVRRESRANPSRYHSLGPSASPGDPPEAEGFRVWYAIADAAHVAPPGSALFAEALRRGATAYLPGRVVSMLPKSLSEGIVSLLPGVLRRAVVWEMEIAPDGRCVRTQIHLARIRSRAKLAYDRVQAWLDGVLPAPTTDPAALASLRALPAFGRRRQQVAEERGVVRYRRRELAVGLGADGLRFIAQADDRNDVERYNEQLSLLCNVEGAQQLLDGIPQVGEALQPIFRVHQPPEEALQNELAAQLEALVRVHRLDRSRWLWEPSSGRSLAAFLDGLPQEGPEGRLAHAVHRQAVLMNRAAAFRSVPGPHHGVGAPVYGRFSAPMREVVGVYLHQELADLRRHRAGLPLGPHAERASVREAVIQAATDAQARQRAIDRKINRIALDHLFGKRDGPWPATVMGVSRGRLHVQLEQPPIDAKVYFRHLEPRHGRLFVHEDRVAAVHEDGRVFLRVGDAVTVQVQGRDPEADRWALDVYSTA